MIQSVKQLHSLGVFHMDIKIENFLITQDSQLKLIDFNSSIQEPETKKTYGTFLYAAPETIFSE